MRLLEIIARDFGPFERKSCRLEGNLTVIYGPNFTGKTTVGNAVAFALTGRSLTGVKAADLIRRNAASGTAGLIFEVGESRFKLFRSTKARVQLEEQKQSSWVPATTSSIELDTHIEKYVGASPDSLAMTNFLAEGEIAAFVTSAPADRKQMFFRLLGIDLLTDARELFIQARRAAKRNEKTLADQLKAYQPKQHRSKKFEIEQAEMRIRQLYRELQGLSSIDPSLLAKRESLASSLEDLRRQRLDILGTFNSVDELTLEIERLSTSTAEHKRLLAEKNRAVEELAYEQASLDIASSQRESVAQMLADHSQVCPTCSQPITESLLYRLSEERDREIAQRRARTTELKEKIRKYDQDLARVEMDRERLKRFEMAIQRVRALNDRIRGTEVELNEADQEIKSRGPATHADARQVAALEAELQDEQKRLRELIAEDAIVQKNLGEVARLTNEVNKAEHERLRMELAVDALERTIEAIIEEKLRPAESQMLDLFSQWHIFNGFRPDIVSEYLLPVLSGSEGRIDLRQMSASEKMLIYLAMKVSLARTTNEAGFFLFDDPTLHLDGERTNLLAEFLRILAEQRQVIVLTNDERLITCLPGASIIYLAETQVS